VHRLYWAHRAPTGNGPPRPSFREDAAPVTVGGIQGSINGTRGVACRTDGDLYRKITREILFRWTAIAHLDELSDKGGMAVARDNQEVLQTLQGGDPEAPPPVS